MRLEDLRSLSQIGQVLWVDPELSYSKTAETLQAVALLQVTEDRLLESSCKALLARAQREREQLAPTLLSDPFFRLLPEERFILMVLHQERWSYARLARVLGQTEEQVSAFAWRLRVHLASQRVDPAKPWASFGASGAPIRGASCPEFNPSNPWTQRFLDEELQARERLFMQNHLMACEGCRAALHRCRDLYYLVDGMIPKREAVQVESLQQVFQKMTSRVRSSEIRWRDAGLAYFRKTETQLIVAGVLTWIFVRLFW